jgi:GNAT superfamily N-acetyltransferase
MIVVRRATLEDKEAIFRFIKVAYPDRWQYKIPERWQWEYVENPFLEGKDLPVFIAIDEQGNVVGQTCTLVEPLKIGDRLCKVGWSVDTFLLPQYRGQGIGFQLQKANDEANEIFMSLNMSLANRRIKAGLGSVPIDPVRLYTRLVRFEPESIAAAVAGRLARHEGAASKAISTFLRLSFLDRIMAGLLNGWLALKDRLSLEQADPGLVIQPIDTFGEEADRLWEKISARFYALVRRDKDYLDWKYVRQPFVEYAPFMARREGKICGMLILRTGKPPERYLGVIADLIAAPEDEAVIQDLLTFAVRYFKKARVKDILAASSVRPYQAGLEALGFKQMNEAFPMFHCKVESPECKAAQEPGSWLLSKGDHDWDQYPLAR